MVLITRLEARLDALTQQLRLEEGRGLEAARLSGALAATEQQVACLTPLELTVHEKDVELVMLRERQTAQLGELEGLLRQIEGLFPLCDLPQKQSPRAVILKKQLCTQCPCGNPEHIRAPA